MPGTRKKKIGGGWLLFWPAFFIGTTTLFLLNLERIKGTLEETKLLEKFVNSKKTVDEASDLGIRIQDLTLQLGEIPETGGFEPEQPGILSAVDPVKTDLQDGEQEQVGQNSITAELPEKTVARSVYLLKVDSTGTILWTTVKRELPASDSPLSDVMEALIKGPSVTEEKLGLISLIPKNVKILNTVVRGSTAYISFSENFLFNTYGVEGYVGQRSQIVLTATEFSNVKDVQILIDGKRVDYLGEGIWIGSPVGRN
ncbi:MAG: GerMN domain-containing protein, partial [Treponema sp.]|nr:GerMN domain-containing protein [Treponema sp.]